MKNTIALLLALAAFIFSLYAAFGPRPESRQNERPSIFADKEEKSEEPEIADFMLYIQHFHHKLYLSAKAGNASLCKFYLNEMGEKMQEISQANIWSNGVNISLNMRTYGLQMVDQFLKKDPQSIFKSFDDLSQACNSCHAASKHPDIKIKTPVNADYPNQDFMP